MKTVIEINQGAISSSKRRITKYRKGGCVRRMCASTGEWCSITTDPTSQTADWRFGTLPRSSKVGHIIRVGVRLDDLMRPSLRTNDRQRHLHTLATIRHETEHGLQTDRDLKGITEELARKRLPFRLLNLFEDARIEYNSAKRTGGDGKFGWTRWEELVTETDKAVTAFYVLKSSEAGLKKSTSAYLPTWTGALEVDVNGGKGTPKMRRTRNVITSFYRNVIAASDTQSLVELVSEWVKIFGHDDADMPDRIEGELGGERDPNAPSAPSDADSEPSDEDSVRTDPVTREGEDSTSEKDENDTPKTTWIESRADEFRKDIVLSIKRDMSELIRRASTAKNRISSHGSKLSMKHVIERRSRVMLARGAKSGRRKVTVVLDCSGSMHTLWHSGNMKELVIAISELHAEHVLDATLILTKELRRSVAGSYKVAPEDFNADFVSRIKMDANGERIKECMTKHKGTLARAKSNLILTDSDLTDRDCDLTFIQQENIPVIAGCAAFSPAYVSLFRERMDKNFKRSCVAVNACELAGLLTREMLKD